MADDNNRAGSTNVDVTIGGTDVPDAELIRMVVDLDLDQPAMCVLTLKNAGSRHSNTHKQGDEVEIKVTSNKTTIFKGEIVGIEPIYEAGGDFKCVIRAFDRLHRLLRGRNSKTYQDQSDNDIVNAIVGNHGLQAQCGSDVNITHKHVYQHNQTDLEFLRLRASRIGYSVWCEDKTLHFEKPKTDQDSGIEFKLTKDQGDGQNRVRKVSFNMSSARVVNKVTVRAWDPEKKESIVGEVAASGSKLGATDAASAAKTAFDEVKTFTVDHPVASVEEAKAIAQAKLDDAMMSYITGEAECFGNPAYKPGIVVKFTVNQEQNDDLFNGKYFVVGVAHLYSQAGPGGGSGGYTSILKVARDAQKGQ